MPLRRLNALPRDRFVGAIGDVFEHSPWVAERAWEQRPFGSIGELHEKLVATMRSAADSEKMALINAHPDLVGSMAQEGRLTQESTAEQAAAGLNGLSPAEV